MIGRILIVDPDRDHAALAAELVSRVRVAHIVASVDTAIEFLRRPRSLTAVVTEAFLPEGSGLEVVEWIRRRQPLLPALVMSSRLDPESINQAQRWGAAFQAKPLDRQAFRSFLDYAISFERIGEERTARLLREFGVTYELSSKETDVLAAGVRGLSRKQLARELGVSENTVKSCVKSLLRKCDRANLQEVQRELLHSALEGSRYTSSVEGQLS